MKKTKFRKTIFELLGSTVETMWTVIAGMVGGAALT